MKYLLLLLSTSIFYSCTNIISQSPAGTTPVKLDVDEWESVWEGGGLYLVTVTDAEKGNIVIGVLDDDDDEKKEGFKITNIKAQIRSYKNTKFINIKNGQFSEDDKVIPDEYKNSYTWIPFVRVDSSIILYNPNEQFFKGQKYIKELTIDKKKYYKIMLDSPSLSKLIDSNIDSAIQWKNPFMVLRKVNVQ